MDSQPQCGIFRLPPEIRQEIYGYLDFSALHISRQNQRLVLSDCKTPNPSHSDDGRERRSRGQEGLIFTKPWDSDVICARRLASTWGPHWACEYGFGGEEATTLPLLLVCKRMLEDLVTCLTFHVTDLDTLASICKRQSVVDADLPLGDWRLFLATGMRSLHVTLRLPLETFQALDSSHESPQEHHGALTAASLWSGVWPTVAHLQSLRNLEIELDHVDPSSWSLVNERAVLSPIATLAERTSHRTTVVTIPHLHPFYEDTRRHYTDDSEGPPFSIRRRTRQKFHCGEDGSVVESRYDTFPLLWPLVEELEALQYEPDWPGLSPEARKKRVDEERALWKKGVDVRVSYDTLQEELNWPPMCTGG